MAQRELVGKKSVAEPAVSPVLGVAALQAAFDDLKKCATTDCRSPAEMAVNMETVGVAKARRKTLSMALLGVMAGVFIGMGAVFCTLVTTDMGVGFGLTRLLGGVVFSLGLILVVLAGAELFTGNVLMVGSRISGRITVPQLLRNWGIVYLGNLVGSLLLVLVIYYSQFWALGAYKVGANALLIANAKVNLAFWVAFSRGILCNALVCLAVWMCFGARSVVDKVFAILFPITAFVACGFEHSIANMYFIPIGMALAGKAEVVRVAGAAAGQLTNLNLAGFLVSNLIPVTLGNIVGGTFVGGMYWFAYLREERAVEALDCRPWMKRVFAQHAFPAKQAAYLDSRTQALIAVLARARDDSGFLSALVENPQGILKGYDLDPEARAALESGDVRWLESKVGVLDEPLRAWITSRLGQEKW